MLGISFTSLRIWQWQLLLFSVEREELEGLLTFVDHMDLRVVNCVLVEKEGRKKRVSKKESSSCTQLIASSIAVS